MLQASRSGHSKSSNTAVVKPHDSVIVIQGMSTI